MTQAWDASNETLKDVSDSDAKELSRLGVPIGQEAELKAREAGWEGKLGAGLTALGNSAGLGIPKLITRALSPGTAKSIDTAQEQHPYSTLAGDLAGGAVSMAAAPTASARILAGAYQGGTSAFDRSIQSGEWDKAVNTGDYTKVAEHFMQGVGIGGALSAGVEGAAKVLPKLATKTQKIVGKTLTDWSNKGYFQKLVDLDTAIPKFEQAASELNMGAEHVVQQQAHLDRISQARNVTPVPRPYEGLTEKPPPLPNQDIPFAQASSVVEPGTPEDAILAHSQLSSDIGRENVYRGRERQAIESDTAKRLSDRPLTEQESSDLRHLYDKEAYDSSVTGGEYYAHNEAEPFTIGEDNFYDSTPVTQELRARRDAVPRGLSPEEMSRFEETRAQFLKPDAQLEAGFEHAGLNQSPDSLAELPQAQLKQAPVAQPELTELPQQPRAITPTHELLEPSVIKPRIGPLAKTQGRQAADAVPEFAQTAKLPKLPSVRSLDKSGAISEATPWNSLDYNQPRYDFKKGREPPSMPGIARDMGIAGVGAALHNVNPFLGYALGGHAAYSALRNSAKEMGMLAQRAAINRSDSINLMVNKVISGPLSNAGRVVKTLLQSSNHAISNSYLSGDTDKDYQDIVQAVTSAQANPQQALDYYHARYGPLSQDGKFFAAMMGHTQNAVNYLAQGVYKQDRPTGLLDGGQPVDPPHNIKLKMIQRYNGVNDPHGTLAAPTYEGVAAVQAVHPQTLAEIRANLAEELIRERTRLNLSPGQKRDISIVMGIPTDWINSPAGIAALASVTPDSQSPQQQQQPQPKQSQGRGINLGGQAKGYASMTVPPSDQNDIDNMGD